MSEKLVLIDGHSILNRAFFGIPDLTNSEGLHTNAVYGFLNIMFKILEEEQPDYLTVRQRTDLQPPPDAHALRDGPLVVLGAARLGQTRLIDNLEF